MNRPLSRFCALLALPLAAGATEPPQVEISNGVVHAQVYLPDAADGYYRATRFDWSGVVSNLEWKGHSYFGKWFARYDPKINDAIMGPVEEFQTNGSALGYSEAKAGETFVKIGVGVLRKPDESAYRQFSTYEIIDGGRWNVAKGADWIEFTHKLTAPSGYAYVYRKTLRLTKDRPGLAIEHSLKNTGRKTIETNVYEHNFFMLDGQPSGPDFRLIFPFAVQSDANWNGLADLRGNELHYLTELQARQTVLGELHGYGAAAKDYDIRVENLKTHAGVHQTGNLPLAKLMFWSIRNTVCPEAYVSMRIEPGQESAWRIDYEFYEPAQ
jgi:hypothetical protein